jgi:hypothetical protein
MNSLFPINSLEAITVKENKKIEFKGSYAFNFETKEFIKNPNGTIKILDEFEGYIQWCEKAMLTARYKYMAYSNRYGKDSIDLTLDKKVMELEIKRITKEALMVHPMTSSVDNFSFDWRNGEVYYSYEVTTTQKQKKIITSIQKVG